MTDKLSAEDVANHSKRIDTFRKEISNHYTDMSIKSMLENKNRENLLSRLDRYFVFSIVELIIILVMCVIQVELVKKLLCNNTYVV